MSVLRRQTQEYNAGARKPAVTAGIQHSAISTQPEWVRSELQRR
jgi:hypothetical protein